MREAQIIGRIGTVAIFVILLLTITYGVAFASDIIPYQQLSESDFTSPNAPPPTENAEAATGLDVDISGQAVKPEMQADGTFKACFNDWTVRAIFDKSQSSWKNKDANNKNIPDPELLKHEQGHFDTAQILAKKLNEGKKKALADVCGVGATADAAKKDLLAKYNAYVKMVNMDEAAAQQSYDDETDHSKNTEKQKARDKENAAALTACRDKKNDQIKSTSSKSVHYDAATNTLTFTDDTITGIEHQDGTDAGPDALIGGTVVLPSFTLQGYTVGGAAFFVPVADDQFSIKDSSTVYLAGEVPFLFYFDNQFLANPPNMSVLDPSSAFIGRLQNEYDSGDPFSLAIQIFPDADFAAVTNNFTQNGVSTYTNLVGNVTPVPEAPGSTIVAAGLVCLTLALLVRSRRIGRRHSKALKETSRESSTVLTARLRAVPLAIQLFRFTIPMALILLGTLVATPGLAQFQTQVYRLSDAERSELEAGRDHLRQSIQALKPVLRREGRPESLLLPDIEIFLDAVDRNLEQNLFFSKSNVDQAKACLKEGEARAEALKEGTAPWTRQTGTVVLGYRSKIDGSNQPYQVSIPAGYDFDAKKPMRLEVFLHGRGGNLNEPAFIRSGGWVKGNFGGKTPDYLALYPYGRGNNGWRFAGETDVFEALADCKRRYLVDEDQTTLRGFSMGGHGVFHIGLHYPGLWAIMSPGAGFVDTKQYLGLKQSFTEWQDGLLHLYDAVDVAENAKNLPLINYVGELDPKLPQYRLMAAALKKVNAPFEEIIAPKTEHRYEAAALQSILDKMAPVRREPLSDVHFATYTLRYPACKWVKILALEHHWQRAEVNGSLASPDRPILTTRNITALSLNLPEQQSEQVNTVTVDGQVVTIPIKRQPSVISVNKHNGKWQVGAPTGLHKAPGLQGPIDDALFGPMIAVAGTGVPWNENVDQWTKQELERFRVSWGRYFRASLPETKDSSLTPDDIRLKNLYLFGDPGSNAVLKRLLPNLPLHWTKDAITIKGKTFSAKDHLPLLIFPNPENPEHYIVINTGTTFSRSDQEGSNAQQYPHLPDYAVIRFDPDHFSDDRTKDTEFAGFFDENWR